ncbi:PREDICTED: uncharacterized protein LOC104800514 [Tarenaya hassleriana]|uniref:uncharacterized protein LOC104800514 n=1 Tax=Tarenaya hassleriana TaxID=28532 RepID=UPI00053C7067|nr:PREDICTED: uncharacterized protein LOC104800514 [Tarenaya hassleriana]XP_010521633.1 PREDICTED: uncharacterized protein LOC104800514 [Tarenaya hassleriana]
MSSYSSASSSPKLKTSNEVVEEKKSRKCLIIVSACLGFLVALLAAGGISFRVLYLTKPTFMLQDVSPYPSDVPSPTGGPSVMVSLTSHNPSRSAMWYGDLKISMSVNGKETETAHAYGMYHEPKSTGTWTVVLGFDVAGVGQGAKGVVSATVPVQWHVEDMLDTPVVTYHVKCPMKFSPNGSYLNRESLVDVSKCSVH